LTVRDAGNGEHEANSAAARRSLEGLALGDAFGERWFRRDPGQASKEVLARRTPDEPEWPWTDDTAMALGILRTLDEHGEIRQNDLALAFARVHDSDPDRGYGRGMRELLPRYLQEPERWPELTHNLFRGEGSLGNGAAMRVAPLGAWFRTDIPRVVAQATLSAEVTHAHPEGIAGAVAVAVASALSARRKLTLEAVVALTPASSVREELARAAQLAFTTKPSKASDILGSGKRYRAEDTVPFAVWSACRHPDDLVSALWTTSEGLGDVDTTCAITGGIVAARTGVDAVPQEWLLRREPLPGG
jgi:ADP-ribosylglycohydrolase